jgi:hypothetical protein
MNHLSAEQVTLRVFSLCTEVRLNYHSKHLSTACSDFLLVRVPNYSLIGFRVISGRRCVVDRK